MSLILADPRAARASNRAGIRSRRMEILLREFFRPSSDIAPLIFVNPLKIDGTAMRHGVHLKPVIGLDIKRYFHPPLSMAELYSRQHFKVAVSLILVTV